MDPRALSTSDLFHLDQRTILVTGGLGGLGVVLVQSLLESGADIVVTDLPAEASEDVWNSLASKAEGCHAKLFYRQLDVTQHEHIDAFFTSGLPGLRYPLRGVVCAAGISGGCPAVDYPVADLKRIMDVNVIGTFLCARAAANVMRQNRESGSIVIIASMSATNVNRGVVTSVYNASKSALLQMARSFASEWGNDPEFPPIRVNTLSPGYIRTEATGPTLRERPELEKLWSDGNMLGRLSYPEEFRAPVIFLLGDGSSFMTASDLRIDGGHCAW